MPYWIVLPPVLSEGDKILLFLPACPWFLLYLSTYSLTTQKTPFLARYVTALKLGLRHGASWMDLSKAWRLWGSSNGAKFLLPSEAHLILLHAKKNRVYSLTWLPCTAFQTLILRTQLQGHQVISSAIFYGYKEVSQRQRWDWNQISVHCFTC